MRETFREESADVGGNEAGGLAMFYRAVRNCMRLVDLYDLPARI